MSSRGEARVGDAGIEFLREGAGDAVVLIPGGGLDASHLGGLARHIAAAGFRAVAVNPRGVGGSQGRPEGLTLHALAGDVGAVIEALGSGPAHVVGHGFSHRVARCLAADRPDLVRSVILLAGVAEHGRRKPDPEAFGRPATRPGGCARRGALSRMTTRPAGAADSRTQPRCGRSAGRPRRA